MTNLLDAPQALITFLFNLMVHTPVGLFVLGLFIGGWLMILRWAFFPAPLEDINDYEDHFDEEDYR